VVEVVRRKFLPNTKVKKINIGTDQLSHPVASDGSTNVSTIEIVLER
jgi:DNA-binding protein Alba